MVRTLSRTCSTCSAGGTIDQPALANSTSMRSVPVETKEQLVRINKWPLESAGTATQKDLKPHRD